MQVSIYLIPANEKLLPGNDVARAGLAGKLGKSIAKRLVSVGREAPCGSRPIVCQVESVVGASASSSALPLTGMDRRLKKKKTREPMTARLLFTAHYFEPDPPDVTTEYSRKCTACVQPR